MADTTFTEAGVGVKQKLMDMGDGTWAEVVVTRAGAPVGGTGSAGPPTISTPTSVADSATSVTLLAANAARKGAFFKNTSSAILYILEGSGTASVANCHYDVPTRTLCVLDLMDGGVYTGIVKGIWATDPGDGACVVAEFT